MQQEHKVDSSTATLTLLDAPDPWFKRLLSEDHLDSASKPSLFQTCQRLNEVVMQHSKCTSLSLGLLTTPLDKAVQLLQRVNRHAPSVKLRLRMTERHVAWGQSEEQQMAQLVSSFLQAAGAQGATTAVTEVHLKGTWLETILPPAVGQACPNLVKLKLDQCTINIDSTISFNQQFSKLQSLELDSCDFSNDAVSSDEQPETDLPAPKELSADMKRLRSQLVGLTALRSLAVVDDQQDPQYDTEFSIVNALAAQLTHLCLNLGQPHDELTVEDDLKPLDWVQLWPSLQHLELPGMEAGNKAMRMLLSMPRLTRLEVNFTLEESFAGQPCKWEELVCENIDMRTLAYLPLHPGLLLKVGTEEGDCQLSMYTATSELIRQAIGNVQKAKALVWAETGLQLKVVDPNLEDMPASQLAQYLEQSLPLFKHVQELRVLDGELNEAAMQVLCEFVCSREDKPRIRLGSLCRWKVEDAVTLVRHMPHNSMLDLVVEGADSENQIIELCGAVQRKLTLLIKCTPQKFIGFAMFQGIQQSCLPRISAAMQARGLEVVYMGIANGMMLLVTVQASQSSLP